MTERRGKLRRRTLHDGRLATDHVSTLDCVVRNRSKRGARLLCRAAPSIGTVSLEIKALPGFRKKARIVWRRLEDCGVEFISLKRLWIHRASHGSRLAATRRSPGRLDALSRIVSFDDFPVARGPMLRDFAAIPHLELPATAG